MVNQQAITNLGLAEQQLTNLKVDARLIGSDVSLKELQIYEAEYETQAVRVALTAIRVALDRATETQKTIGKTLEVSLKDITNLASNLAEETLKAQNVQL